MYVFLLVSRTYYIVVFPPSRFECVAPSVPIDMALEKTSYQTGVFTQTYSFRPACEPSRANDGFDPEWIYETSNGVYLTLLMYCTNYFKIVYLLENAINIV